VSLVVGPDSYRDIGKLVEEAVRDDHFRAETFLSEEETYSDIEQTPLDPSSVQSFLPIMRGCNNMCSFCIVPFTRGRERSRDFQSILAQVQKDVSRGVREVTLLGQNVNSYFVSGEG
jgi:tRNA-2-methylthio-N6-dimethylallyladenosine synthase